MTRPLAVRVGAAIPLPSRPSGGIKRRDKPMSEHSNGQHADGSMTDPLSTQEKYIAALKDYFESAQAYIFALEQLELFRERMEAVDSVLNAANQRVEAAYAAIVAWYRDRLDQNEASVPDLSVPARALGAAFDLQREGKPVSVRAACKRGGVDRKHLRERHPEVASIIENMPLAGPRPDPGFRDRRTMGIEAAIDSD